MLRRLSTAAIGGRDVPAGRFGRSRAARLLPEQVAQLGDVRRHRHIEQVRDPDVQCDPLTGAGQQGSAVRRVLPIGQASAVPLHPPVKEADPHEQAEECAGLPGQIRDAERAKRIAQMAGTNSCPIDPKDLQPTTKQCHGTGLSVPGPARKASPRQTVGAGGLTPRSKPRAVPAGHARALPLPIEGFQEHPDFFGVDDAWISLGSALDYAGGLMPPEVARAVRIAQRARSMTQEAVARHIGISRPQLANALQGRFGLSRSAAENLRAWLTAA